MPTIVDIQPPYISQTAETLDIPYVVGADLAASLSLFDMLIEVFDEMAPASCLSDAQSEASDVIEKRGRRVPRRLPNGYLP